MALPWEFLANSSADPLTGLLRPYGFFATKRRIRRTTPVRASSKNSADSDYLFLPVVDTMSPCPRRPDKHLLPADPVYPCRWKLWGNLGTRHRLDRNPRNLISCPRISAVPGFLIRTQNRQRPDRHETRRRRSCPPPATPLRLVHWVQRIALTSPLRPCKIG